MAINLPTNVNSVSTPYTKLPQPAAPIIDNLIPPYNITISKDGIANFSVAVYPGTAAPTAVEYIPNDSNQGNLNILQVTCSYQSTPPNTNGNVDVYTYTNIDLNVTFPNGNTSVYPLSHAPGSLSLTNEDPENSRGTVVIVKGGDGDPLNK
ncbi:MAG: hypothetical protein MK202_13380 [Tenacibaculum sp.]|nr:hypothetical protein [Tenacibaculum sp.]